MQPPEKPRRPAPDARGIQMARQDVVPGIPKQSPSPRALEAARTAVRDQVRSSSPEVQDVRIEALDHRVGSLESRVARIDTGQSQVKQAIDELVAEVGEWKLTAVSSETVKLQEEGKTKRLSIIVALLTVALNAVVTVGVSIGLRSTPSPHIAPQMGQNDIEIEDCKKKNKADLAEQARCINAIVLRNVTTPSE